MIRRDFLCLGALFSLQHWLHFSTNNGTKRRVIRPQNTIDVRELPFGQMAIAGLIIRRRDI